MPCGYLTGLIICAFGRSSGFTTSPGVNNLSVLSDGTSTAFSAVLNSIVLFSKRY